MSQVARFQLPTKWSMVRLGDHLKLINGRAYKREELLDSGTPVLRIQNLNGGNRWYFSDLELPSDKYCDAGDLLFAWSATFGPYIWNGPRAIYHYHIWKILPEPTIDKRYAFRMLEWITESVKAAAHGITMVHITKASMENWEIPLPPLEEQRRIAAILDTADTLRTKRRQAIAKLDTLLQSTFLTMFGDPVTNPMGWEIHKLNKIATIRRGASPRPISNYLGGTIPWIKIGDATKGDRVYIKQTAEKVTEEGALKSVYLQPGALVVANSGVSLGFARILKIAGCIHDGWLSLEDIAPTVHHIYLLKLINHLTMYFRQIAPSGTQPNLNTTIIKNFEIPVPPIALQVRFAQIVSRFEDMSAQQDYGIEMLDGLFQAMQQRAFRGDL